ncbi:MAG: HD domain-containing phosphohydrolase [Caldisericum sp.]|uniref:HD domain-containing phosphohydrolase n=1 Tax=Caldisericum sp. TaxID=2499687 RepID=UPI003D09D8FF
MNNINIFLLISLLISLTFAFYFFYRINELSKKIKRQEIILNGAQKLSRMLYELEEQENFLREMWNILKTVTNADEFTYFKFDGIDTLIPEYVEGIYRDQILKTRLKLGEGFSGKVALEKTPKYLNSANKSNIAKHIPGTPNEDSALLAVPIVFNDELYGVILLTKLGNKKFNEEELNRTEMLVNMAASLIAEIRLVNTIKNSFIEMLKALITAVELKDTYTAGHSLRVSKIAEIIAENMGLPATEIARCRIGGLLHDIGKIGIKEDILKNDTPLTPELREDIIRHPELGYKLIKKLKILESVAETVLYHHEWFNGKGYPFRLKGSEIPISSRIVHVADAIDAMVSGRPHSKRKTLNEAMEELIRFSGIQFDPLVVKVALQSKEEIESILKEDIKESILDDEKLFEIL